MALTKWSGGNLAGKADGLIFQNYRGIKIVRSYFIPRNPRTPEQQAHRHSFGSASKISATIYNQYLKGRLHKPLGKLPFNEVNKAICAVYENLPFSLSGANLPYDWTPNDTGGNYIEVQSADAPYWRDIYIGLKTYDDSFDWLDGVYIGFWNKSLNAYITRFSEPYEMGIDIDGEREAYCGLITIDSSFRHQGLTPYFYSFYHAEKGVSNFFFGTVTFN